MGKSDFINIAIISVSVLIVHFMKYWLLKEYDKKVQRLNDDREDLIAFGRTKERLDIINFILNQEFDDKKLKENIDYVSVLIAMQYHLENPDESAKKLRSEMFSTMSWTKQKYYSPRKDN